MAREDVFNSVTIEMMQRSRGSRWRRYGPDVIPLYVADPEFPVAPEIRRAVIQAVEDNYFGYSLDVDVQEAAARKVKVRNGIDAMPDDILLTQGVSPGMWLAVKYSCKPGDEVIVSDPMYSPFYRAVDACEAKKVYWKAIEEERYRFDIDVLNKLVTDKTKLIMVCNPHNPTGHVFTEKELRNIGEIAINKNLLIMCDELHEDIVLDGRKHVSIASLSPEIAERTITCFGISKTYGVAGLQLGYAVATNKKIMEGLKSRSTAVLRGTNSLAKAAAPVMLDDTLKWWRIALPKHIAKVRDLVEKRLKEIGGIKCPKVEGTFLMFPNMSSYRKTSKDLTDYLLSEGKVAVANGANFGPSGEGHVRISMDTSEGIMNEALNRMERALSKLKVGTISRAR